MTYADYQKICDLLDADLQKEHNYYVAAMDRGAKTDDIWTFYQKEQIRNKEIKISLRKAILAQVRNEFPDNKELIAFWDVDEDQ